MGAKLIIDLGKSRLQNESGVRCSYKHHPDNKGFDSLLEMVRFALICRRCELAPCIEACPSDALEKVSSETNDAGVLKRADMLCTGCGTCSLACPFGTIYPELILFPTSVCDVCRGRLEPDEKPLCVRTCQDGSIEYGEVDVEAEDDLVEVFKDIVVRVSGGVLWEPFLREEEKATP
ncbi:4Fe-4S binding protein [Candidatus Bipolaricaulota bacterium]|nr:4Fe-4S binding protein [Candidatus Bipolaricaulota bacterium]